MTATILVPLDGSPLAEEVLPLASEVARKTDARLLLFTAVHPVATWDPSAASVRWDEEEKLARAYLGGQREKIAATGLEVGVELHLGNPAEQILKACDEFGAGMLAFSTHGRSGIARFVFGSVARRVLESTTLPALIVRPRKDQPSPTTITRILVPLDGSPVAESVLPEVVKLAKTFGASITLFNAIAPLATYPGFETIMPAASRDVFPELQTQADAYLAEVARGISAEGIEVKAVTTLANAADGILDAANQTGADLIAIGTHGRSGIERAVLGSVADAVIRRSDLPVFAIHPKQA